jgi:hypothetical protein
MCHRIANPSERLRVQARQIRANGAAAQTDPSLFAIPVINAGLKKAGR